MGECNGSAKGKREGGTSGRLYSRVGIEATTTTLTINNDHNANKNKNKTWNRKAPGTGGLTMKLYKSLAPYFEFLRWIIKNHIYNYT